MLDCCIFLIFVLFNCTNLKCVEYMKQFEDKVLAAGPTLTEDGNGVGDGMTGSVFIIDFPDRSGADDFCVHDPYQKAGLFESTVIKPFRKVVPQD